MHTILAPMVKTLRGRFRGAKGASAPFENIFAVMLTVLVTIGLARGGHGRAFVQPSLIFALPSRYF